jgi:hypothetical protein
MAILPETNKVSKRRVLSGIKQTIVPCICYSIVYDSAPRCTRGICERKESRLLAACEEGIEMVGPTCRSNSHGDDLFYPASPRCYIGAIRGIQAEESDVSGVIDDIDKHRSYYS